MNGRKIFLNVIVGSSLILLFCCSGSKKVVLQEEANEVNYIPYYLKVYEADSLYWAANYSRSYNILDSLFNKYQPVNLFEEINQFLVSALKLNKIKGKEKYIELIFKEWGFIREDFENYPEIELLCKKLNVSDKTLSEWEQYYLANNVNFNLRNKVDSLIGFDQLYRGKEADHSKLDSIDKLTEPQVVNILQKYGFPNRKIGLGILRLKGEEYKFLDISTILNHTSDSLRENYLFDKLLKEVKKGNMDPAMYGANVDQYHVYNDNPQIFGSMFKQGSDELTPLKYSMKQTKELRKQYGMTPNPFYRDWRNEQIDKKFNQ